MSENDNIQTFLLSTVYSPVSAWSCIGFYFSANKITSWVYNDFSCSLDSFSKFIKALDMSYTFYFISFGVLGSS